MAFLIMVTIAVAVAVAIAQVAVADDCKVWSRACDREGPKSKDAACMQFRATVVCIPE